MTILVNIDVPDLAEALAFYTEAFGLRLTRRFGEMGAELAGWPIAVFLLEKAAGTVGAGGQARRYARHWTPVLDVVVDDVAAAVSRAVAAGVVLERPVSDETWGKIAGLADPFGNGFCLIQFQNRGYDEIASRS